MEFLLKGEELAKIKAGIDGDVIVSTTSCGGNEVYCRSDAGCGLLSQCVHPATYAGCSGGILTFPDDTSIPVEGDPQTV